MGEPERCQSIDADRIAAVAGEIDDLLVQAFIFDQIGLVYLKDHIAPQFSSQPLIELHERRGHDRGEIEIETDFVTPNEVDPVIKRLENRLIEVGCEVVEQPAVGGDIETRTDLFLYTLYGDIKFKILTLILSLRPDIHDRLVQHERRQVEDRHLAFDPCHLFEGYGRLGLYLATVRTAARVQPFDKTHHV